MENENMDINNYEANTSKTLEEQLTEKLNEKNIEISKKEIDALVNSLALNKVTDINMIEDLNGFSPRKVNITPKRVLLVNNLFVYVFEHRENDYIYEDEYNIYLEENDLIDTEFSYDQFLSEKGLIDENEREKIDYEIFGERIGDVHIQLLKQKNNLEKELEYVSRTYSEVHRIMKEKFLPFLK